MTESFENTRISNLRTLILEMREAAKAGKPVPAGKIDEWEKSLCEFLTKESYCDVCGRALELQPSLFKRREE